MSPEDIQRLALAAQRSGIAEADVTADGTTIRLRVSLDASPIEDTPASRPTSKPAAFKGVKSPGVGIFRSVHPTTGRALIQTGQSVSKDQIVAYLQVGSALRAVVAPSEGVLGKALLEDGAVVGFGRPLYKLS